MIDKSKWPRRGETWRTRDGQEILVSQDVRGNLIISPNGHPCVISPNGDYCLLSGVGKKHRYDLIEKVEPLPAPRTAFLNYYPGNVYSPFGCVSTAADTPESNRMPDGDTYEVEIIFKRKLSK